MTYSVVVLLMMPLDMELKPSFLSSVMSNVALYCGSSKQGKTFRASVDCSWLVNRYLEGQVDVTSLLQQQGMTPGGHCWHYYLCNIPCCNATATHCEIGKWRFSTGLRWLDYKRWYRLSNLNNGQMPLLLAEIRLIHIDVRARISNLHSHKRVGCNYSYTA